MTFEVHVTAPAIEPPQPFYRQAAVIQPVGFGLGLLIIAVVVWHLVRKRGTA
jgi:hypothetical protein